MIALSLAPQDAIAQLDALLASARLPAREALRCERLAETLRRPVRVCVLGPARGDIGAVLPALLDHVGLPPDRPDPATLPPAVELRHAPALRAAATFEDGTRLAREGWPTGDMLDRDPVYLQLDLPAEPLRAMSFLVLALDPDPAIHRPALTWAARRADMAVWCTPRFGAGDARVWAEAPERLRQHAHLLETRTEAGDPLRGAVGGFAGAFALPLAAGAARPDLRPLLDRLAADIEEARLADLDMAQVFLHRLGHLSAPAPAVRGGRAPGRGAPLPDAGPPDVPQDLPPGITGSFPARHPPLPPAEAAGARPDPSPATPSASAAPDLSGPLLLRDPVLPGHPARDAGMPDDDLRPVLSDALLYLAARAQGLAEHLALCAAGTKDAAPPADGARGRGPGDWTQAVLVHCADTVEGLRERSCDWPEEPAALRGLQTLIEEVCDTATLLRVEAGPDAAQTAASLLLHLRLALEQALGWGSDRHDP